MLARALPLFLLVTLTFAACGSDSSDYSPTPLPVTRGVALQIFLRQAYEDGLFAEGDPIELEVEAMLYGEAASTSQEHGLGLFATAPGEPPYPDGLPGFLIIASGDFFVQEGEGEPSPDTPRRPAIAAAFVDTQGRSTYAWRFTD
jgi:hypothetical protein